MSARPRGSVAAVAALTMLGLLLFAAPAAAAPTVTVTPNSELVDGQTVTVNMSGYTQGRRIWVSQCTQNPESRNDCDEDSLTGPIDIPESGEAQVQFDVIAGEVGVNGGRCDANNPCTIWAQEIPPIGDADVGHAVITFAASTAPAGQDGTDDGADDGADTTGGTAAGTGDDGGDDEGTTAGRSGNLASTGVPLVALLLLAAGLAVGGASARRLGRRSP